VLSLSRRCRGAERRRFWTWCSTRNGDPSRDAQPNGDPTAYRIRGALIALRAEQRKRFGSSGFRHPRRRCVSLLSAQAPAGEGEEVTDDDDHERRLRDRGMRGLSGPSCAESPETRRHMENWNFVVRWPESQHGKSTVFNALTGSAAYGNWPGKTSRGRGGFEYHGHRSSWWICRTYSLLAASPDEEAREISALRPPDVTLVSWTHPGGAKPQPRPAGAGDYRPVVVCLNLMDEARRHGLQVDDRTLSASSGAGGSASARYKQGLDQVLQAVSDVATGQLSVNPAEFRRTARAQRRRRRLPPGSHQPSRASQRPLGRARLLDGMSDHSGNSKRRAGE